MKLNISKLDIIEKAVEQYAVKRAAALPMR
jgi:hypothetical protein